MLEIKTVLVFLVISGVVNGVVGLLVWHSYKHLDGIVLIAAGYIFMAVATVMLIFRNAGTSPILIILHNLIYNQCLAFGVVGMARFLAQPVWRHLSSATCLATLLLWSAAFVWVPDNISPRIIASSIFTAIAMLYFLRMIANDRGMSGQLRWFGMFVVGEHAVITCARIVRAVLDFGQSELIDAPSFQAWFFLEGCLFSGLFFTFILFLISQRLTNDLRKLNQDLSEEVSHRRRLQQELSAALSAEKQLRQEQRQFLYVIGHEIRTPLAVIDRSAEMVETLIQKPSRDVASRLSNIHEAVRKLVSLIEHLLINERAEQSITKMEICEIGQLIASAMQPFVELGGAGRIHIELPSRPTFIMCDIEMMTIAIKNIIENAVKYSPDHTMVKVLVEKITHLIKINVIDSGIGISQVDIEKIGKKFFRSANTKRFSGSGLGVYSVRKIVELHHGSVTIDSKLDGGTSVAVVLPCHGS